MAKSLNPHAGGQAPPDSSAPTGPPRRNVLAACDYGGAFAAIVGRDNFLGTQFHVEKSQATGLALIGNFLEWRP